MPTISKEAARARSENTSAQELFYEIDVLDHHSPLHELLSCQHAMFMAYINNVEDDDRYIFDKHHGGDRERQIKERIQWMAEHNQLINNFLIGCFEVYEKATKEAKEIKLLLENASEVEDPERAREYYKEAIDMLNNSQTNWNEIPNPIEGDFDVMIGHAFRKFPDLGLPKVIPSGNDINRLVDYWNKNNIK